MRRIYGWVLLAVVVLAGGCLQVIGYEDARGGWAAATCSDGIKNGNETGKDCGGSCLVCVDGDGCVTGTDCKSKVCSGGTCLAPTCDDKVKNGDEADIDCGGSCPGKCDAGKGCGGAGDCKSARCMGGMCQPTCTDGEKDGAETDVDCGGGTCAACANGLGCMVAGDCTSGVCKVGVCKDYLAWVVTAGDASDQYAATIAVDGAGNVVVGGVFAGTMDWGTGPLTSAGSSDIFLARFTGSGSPLWAKRFDNTKNKNSMRIAADPSGNTFVAGRFQGSINFGSTPMWAMTSSAPSGDMYVATLDGSGSRLSSFDYGDGAVDGIAVDSAGDPFIAGSFVGAADFGGTPLVAKGQADAFVAKLHTWSRQFGGTGASAHASAVALDLGGNVIACGSFTGTADFGTGTPLEGGSGSLFVVKLDPTGNALWAKSFGPVAYGTPYQLPVDTMGNIVLAATFKGSIDFGGGALTSGVFGSLYIAKLDASGAHVWSRSTGATTTKVGPYVSIGATVDSTDNVILTGSFPGTANFGGGPLTSSAATAAFVVKLDPAGTQISARLFGDSGYQAGISVVSYGSDMIYLAGAFAGTIDFGGGLVATKGGYDAFLAKFLLP